VTSEEIISRLRDAKGQVGRIAREAGLPYGTVRKLVTDETKDPRTSTLDALRRYFQQSQ
jgi:K+-transporting ATPase c subunit